MSNDKISPALMDSPIVKKGKYQRDIETARAEGEHEGIKKGHTDCLDFLQNEYLKDGAPERNTPEAKAILILAHNLAAHLRGLEGPKAR